MRLLIAAALAAMPIAAQAAEVQRVNDTIVYRGPVAMGDAVQFRMNLMAAANAGIPIHTVRLNSPGGLVSEAMDMASQIRSAGLDTEVEAGGWCASACFLPFSAGRAKHVGQGARVGVHNASWRWGTDDEAATMAMSLQAKGFGVPDSVLERMTIKTSAELDWLSDEELHAMGATVEPGPAAVPVGVLGANAADSTMTAAGNSWSDPATVKYDAAGSAAAKAISEGEYRKETDALADQATADFNASPLYHAITGK